MKNSTEAFERSSISDLYTILGKCSELAHNNKKRARRERGARLVTCSLVFTSASRDGGIRTRGPLNPILNNPGIDIRCPVGEVFGN